MLKKTLTLATIAALACNCALADGDTPQAQNTYPKNATGQITFDGYVTLPGVIVKVITDEKDAVINTGLNGKTIIMAVPDVDVATLKTTPSNDEMASGNSRNFRIELEGYTVGSSGVMTAEVKVSGTSVSDQNKSIFVNQTPPEKGGASGVGVRLRYKGIYDDSTPAVFTNGDSLVGTFNEAYATKLGRNANYAFHFDAAIVAVSPADVSAGHVTSTVDVVVNYK